MRRRAFPRATERIPAAVALAWLISSTGCATRPAPAVEPPRDAPTLLALLQSPDARLRLRAAFFLASANRSAPGVLEALQKALQDPSEDVREVAIWGLRREAVPGAEGPPYEEPPRVRRMVKPVYPRAAFNDRLEGTVELEVLIGRSGRVVYAWSVRPVPGLTEAAIQTALQWTFEPARRAGEPVATIARLPISFRIY